MSSSLEKLPDPLFAMCASFLQPETYEIRQKETDASPTIIGKNRASVLAPVSTRMQKRIEDILLSPDAPATESRRLVSCAIRVLDLRGHELPFPAVSIENLLTQLSGLITLKLPFTTLPAQGKRYPHIRELDATNTSHDLAFVERFPALETLAIRGVQPNHKAAAPIGNLQQLRSIAIGRSPSKQAGDQWQHVMHACVMFKTYAPHIRELHFPELFSVGAPDLNYMVAKFTALQVLCVDYTPQMDPQLLPQLRTLILNDDPRHMIDFPALVQKLPPDCELIIREYRALPSEVMPNRNYLQGMETLILHAAPSSLRLWQWRENFPRLKTIIFPEEIHQITVKEARRVKSDWPEVQVIHHGKEILPPQRIVITGSMIGNALQAIWDVISWPFR